MVVFPAAAALISALITMRAVQGARRKGNPALWLWAVGFAQFSIASGALALGVAMGWGAVLYRTYYLFGAVLNVVWLALGTIWLLAPRRAAMIVTLLVAAASAYAAAVCLSVPLRTGAGRALDLEVVPAAARVMPDHVRALSRAFSIAGTVVVLGGLGWSMLRKRSRAGGLALLALGVLVVAAASQMIRGGSVLAFSAGLAVGVSVMYLGFVRTGASGAARAGRR